MLLEQYGDHLYSASSFFPLYLAVSLKIPTSHTPLHSESQRLRAPLARD